MKYDIFVSYRRSDRELVASIVRRLEARSVSVWYDAEIEGGGDWRDAIVEALTDSEMLVIFFSDECNNSRQLKKELAVADHLGKPVVPILIEDTQPRGAYLYELADRNWIQAFPEPLEKIDELVEHLVTLAGKDGLLADARIAANDHGGGTGFAAARHAPAASAPPPSSQPMKDAEQPLAEAVKDFITGADASARLAPKVAKAYVGRLDDAGRPIRQAGDILPFKWLDLLAIIPAAAVLFFIGKGPHAFEPDRVRETIIASVLILVFVAAAYGALAFPVRYFLRRKPLGSALGAYLISSAILYVAFAGGYAVAGMFGIGGVEPGQAALQFALIWGGFTLVAFTVYGVLAGQRAIRSFRSNIRKI